GVERLDLPHRVLQHVLLHVLGNHLQARPRHVAGPAPEPPLPGQAHRAGRDAAAVHRAHRALDLRVAVDVRPDVQRAELAALPLGFHHHQAPVPLRRHLRHVVRDRGEHVARHALLRHLAPRRAPDHQHRPAGGGLAGRSQRLAALLARDVAAAQAGDPGGGRVLHHPDLLRLPAHLRAHRRWSRQRDPPARHLRLPDRRGDRSPGRRRRGVPVHAAGPLHRGLAPAALPPPPGRGLAQDHDRADRTFEAGGGAWGRSGSMRSPPFRIMVIERRWKRWVYFYIPLTIFVIGTLFPFYWMLITSIRPDAELYRSWRAANNTPFWTLQPTLEHFRDLMAKTTFPKWLWNTFFIACVSTAISLFCGLLAGYALGRLKFPMAGTLGTSIFVTYLVPPTLLFIPLANIIRTFQLGDTPWALILTYPTFLIPFCTWLLMGYFKTIPKELEECARIDGATRFGAMVRIIFPIAVPGILSAGIFAFTLSWNEFIYALIFLSSPEKKTVPVGVVSELIRGDIYFWGQLMAGALLGSIPVAVVYSFFVEYYVTGLTGSVKG